MFNAYFKAMAGTVADQYFQQQGIHTTLIRYGGVEIKPNPIVGDRGVQSNSDGTEFQLYQSEQVQQFSASIPEESLMGSLGSAWTSAVLPDARWQVSLDGSTWIDVRVQGTPVRSRTGRYGFTLVGKGIGE